MPHLLMVDIDEATLAAVEALVQERALIPSVVQLKLNGQHLPAADRAAQIPSPGSGLVAAVPVLNIQPELLCRDLPRALRDIEPLACKLTELVPPPADSRTLHFACWRLDPATQELRSDDDSLVPLSRTEFEVLYVLVKHPHRWLTRRQIVHFMKGYAQPLCPRSVDVYISRLRRKLEVDTRSPKIVQTVRNGYTFSAAVTIC